MTDEQRASRRYVFTLHLWREPIDADQFEWRGQVKHVTSGELRYFRDTMTLHEVLMAMLAEQDASEHHDCF